VDLRTLWLAARGIKESYGIMVNYLYDPEQIEANHAAFMRGTIVRSAEVDGLLQTSGPNSATPLPGTTATRPRRRDDGDPPERGKGECRLGVRVVACCRTDWHVVSGELDLPHLPVVPGHQVVGSVDALGEGCTRLSAGERVGEIAARPGGAAEQPQGVAAAAQVRSGQRPVRRHVPRDRLP